MCKVNRQPKVVFPFTARMFDATRDARLFAVNSSAKLSGNFVQHQFVPFIHCCQDVMGVSLNPVQLRIAVK